MKNFLRSALHPNPLAASAKAVTAASAVQAGLFAKRD